MARYWCLKKLGRVTKRLVSRQILPKNNLAAHDVHRRHRVELVAQIAEHADATHDDAQVALGDDGVHGAVDQQGAGVGGKAVADEDDLVFAAGFLQRAAYAI